MLHKEKCLSCQACQPKNLSVCEARWKFLKIKWHIYLLPSLWVCRSLWNCSDRTDGKHLLSLLEVFQWGMVNRKNVFAVEKTKDCMENRNIQSLLFPVLLMGVLKDLDLVRLFFSSEQVVWTHLWKFHFYILCCYFIPKNLSPHSLTGILCKQSMLRGLWIPSIIFRNLR